MIVGDINRLTAWASARIPQSPVWVRCNGIGLEHNGELVAAVIYDNWFHPSICGHIASDGTRRWLSREFLQAMFRYPLVQLGCERITAPIDDGNDAAVNFVERLGFVLEGRLRRATSDGRDKLIYGILRSEAAKWL